MLPREYRVVLNPFGEEGRQLVSKAPPLDKMSEEIVERAVTRIRWRDRESRVQPTEEHIRNEVFSFFLMCQALAAVCHPYSRETQYARDSTKNIIRYRLYDLFRQGEGDFCFNTIRQSINLLSLEDFLKSRPHLELPESDYYRLRDARLRKDGMKEVDPQLLPQFLPSFAVRWPEVSLLFKHNRAHITDFYLLDGWAVLTLRDLWDIYAEFIGLKTEEYIQSVYERMAEQGKPGKLVEIGERIAVQIPRTAEIRETVRGVAGKLNPEFFPPCIHNTLNGVGSGLRNFAIVMLLTSFLSYARIAPSGKKGDKISDFINDIRIVTDEIVPLILEAAERCNPPLFSDQPQEKANVFYHLGFGMTTTPRLQDSGKSKWYMVPNCSKIQTSAPPLCQPDELCKLVKNPLTYYFRKRAELGGRRKK